jgi:hypothetical protein
MGEAWDRMIVISGYSVAAESDPVALSPSFADSAPSAGVWASSDPEELLHATSTMLITDMNTIKTNNFPFTAHLLLSNKILFCVETETVRRTHLRRPARHSYQYAAINTSFS